MKMHRDFQGKWKCGLTFPGSLLSGVPFFESMLFSLIYLYFGVQLI